MNTSHGLDYSPVGEGHNTALAQRAEPSSKSRYLVTALWQPRPLLNQHLRESLEWAKITHGVCLQLEDSSASHGHSLQIQLLLSRVLHLSLSSTNLSWQEVERNRKGGTSPPFWAGCPSSFFPEDFLPSFPDLPRETLFSFIPKMQPSNLLFLTNQVCQHSRFITFQRTQNHDTEDMYSCFSI